MRAEAEPPIDTPAGIPAGSPVAAEGVAAELVAAEVAAAEGTPAEAGRTDAGTAAAAAEVDVGTAEPLVRQTDWPAASPLVRLGRFAE